MSEIFRIEKRSDFTIVRNGLLRDKTMSLKAKGLLITMLSKPDGWDYTSTGSRPSCSRVGTPLPPGLLSWSDTDTSCGARPATGLGALPTWSTSSMSTR